MCMYLVLALLYECLLANVIRVPLRKHVVGLLTLSGEKLSYVTHAFRGPTQLMLVNSLCTRLLNNVKPSCIQVNVLRNYRLFLPHVAAAVTVLTAVARRLSYLVPIVYTL